MLELQALGGLTLAGADAVQPKRLALLCYLTLGGRPFQRRDNLLALFWPELDTAHARQSLRQALAALRTLDPQLIATRGDDEVGIAAGRLPSDVQGFQEALQRDELVTALDRYTGPFLSGFFLTDCPEFERWVDRERTRLNELAAAAAWMLAERERSPTVSAQWARRAAALQPDDEGALRRLIGVLDRAGDRLGALREYESFARALRDQYQAQPAPETQILIDAMRKRVTAPQSPGLEPVGPAPQPRKSGSGQRRLVFAASGAAVLAVVVISAFFTRQTLRRDPQQSSRVVVMPFDNRTGVPELDPLGPMLAEWLTQDLVRAPFLTVLNSHSLETATRRLGSAARAGDIARETGAGVVVSGSYALEDDSLRFQAQVSATADGQILLAINNVSAARGRPLAGAQPLAQRLLAGFASLHDQDVRTFQTPLRQPPTYVAYQEYVKGLELYIRDEPDASERFLRAATLDSTFFAARIWAAQAGLIMKGWPEMDEVWVARVDSLLHGLEQIRAQLIPYDQARLDFVSAFRAEDQLAAYDAARRMLDAAPGSLDARREVAWRSASVLHYHDELQRLEQIKTATGLMRQWEPSYWSAQAAIHHALGEFREQLAAASRLHELDPSGHPEIGALIGLGRVSQADSLARLEFHDNPTHSSVLAFSIAGEFLAHGQPEAAHRFAAFAFAHPEPEPPSESSAARAWIIEDRGWARSHELAYCYLGEPTTAHSSVQRARDEWLHRRVELALVLNDVSSATGLMAQMHDPESHNAMLARVLVAQGRPEAARAALERWETRMAQTRGSLKGLELERASVLVRLGDVDKALEILSEGLGHHPMPNSTNSWSGHSHPYLAPILHDPRFVALTKPRG